MTVTKSILLSSALLALAHAVPAQAQLLGGTGNLGAGGLGNRVNTGTAGSITNSGSRINARNAARTQVQQPSADAVRAPDIPSTDTVSAASNTANRVSAEPVNAAANGNLAASANNLAAGGAVTGSIDTDTLALSGAEDVSATSSRTIVTAPPTVITVPNASVSAITVPNVAFRRNALFVAGVTPIAPTVVQRYVDVQYQAIERDLAGTGATVTRRGNQIVIDMPSDVTFAFDKSDIRPRFYGVLNALRGTLSEYPASLVDIIGHSDAKGSDEYNLALSRRRANSVANYLATRAAHPSRFHIEGRGEFEPVDSNATVQGRAANRRVEIILTPYTA